MTRILLSFIILFCSTLTVLGSELVYSSPAEKTYIDTSCCKVVDLGRGEIVYQVAYITVYTAIQSNGAKKVVYIQQYNKSWTQTRIVHQQYYSDNGSLVSWSDAIGNWQSIKPNTIGATKRDKVKPYYITY